MNSKVLLTGNSHAQPRQAEQQLLFDPRFLEQYTGRTLLHDPVSAIVELVANGWDAGATRVDIDWPEVSGNLLRVRDNGEGMTEDQFLRRWLTLSYDRVREQGETVGVVGKPSLPQRHTFGRNGIGRFAAFCFGKEYTVITAAAGKQISYVVKQGIEKPIVLDKQGEVEFAATGTIIEVVQGGQSSLAADTIRAELGKRFLTDPAFEVVVNSERVDFEDIGQRGVETIHVEVEGQPPIRILMIDTERTDRSTKQHGVAWHVNGRLVGKCGWSGNGFDDLVDGRRIEARRYTFIIFADALSSTDAVKADWSGFNEDNSTYQKVREKVLPALRERLLGLAKDRREETTRELRRSNQESLRRMTPLSRQKWNEFVVKAQEECPSLSQPELQSLSGVLAKLEISHSRYSLLHKLHELNPDQLDDLHRILEDWTVDMAKVVLDELRGRLRLVDELRRKTSTTDTLEVQQLQPLFYQGLWIFGPEFETIEFTSNEGMTSVIQKLFDRDIKGSRNRPDFVVLPDGSVGFYAYPKYDDHGAETGVDRLVIVELKKPGVVVGGEQKTQCWKYVKELLTQGLLADCSRIDCYVLGSQIERAESGERKELNDRVRILPLSFDTVLTRAKSRLLKLYDRVKSAPFLRDQNIDAYLDAGDEPANELPLNQPSVAGA
ncbi:MAG: ATP-binding protein [Verrucomicrobia bacterium]|nr:ATP-binding protein [Verrucomicrobiota bacterium]